MNFLPDVYVNCDDCNGKRYNKETLQIEYKNKNIDDAIELNIQLKNINLKWECALLRINLASLV